MDVNSLEDVYWVEDHVARAALIGKDMPRWIQARQSLPTSKDDLENLKTDLWNTVVKNSQHDEGVWTLGKRCKQSYCCIYLVLIIKNNF